MLDDVDWGAFPDYLPALTIAGGAAVFFREWRREHRQAEEARATEELAMEIGAAAVGATLVAPHNASGGSTNALYLEVRNYGSAPVFDVRATVRYVGQVDISPDLRTLKATRTVLAPDDSFSVLEEARKWPHHEFAGEDFTWELEFRDFRNTTWRRGPIGPPTKQGRRVEDY